MFVNRVRELAFLERRYASEQAGLVVLYGHRASFTETLQAEAASQGVLLFGLDDILGEQG
jgi:AAA+ ATPase superfamily predicted ATPase